MSQSQRKILIIDDNPEDRELYRRYLLKDESCNYIILEAELGKQGLALWHEHHPDIVLLDYRLPDLDGLELLAQLPSPLQPPCLPVIMLTGLGNEAIAVKAIKAGAQDYLIKGQITPERLSVTINEAIKSVELRTQLQQRIDRELVVSQITRQIHQTLDLDQILQTTVQEVRQFLQTDRVVIFRLQAKGTGTITTESVSDEWNALLGASFSDPCFNENYVEPFRQGLVTVKADIHNGSIDSCHVELLTSLQVRANLVVPILQANQLWGMLIVHHCAAPRQWQALEIDLLKELATQVGIALQQAELYQRSQAAREAAEQANRLKDEFLAVLSHELRSPLNPILGWTKLLQNHQLDVSQAKEALAVIERNAQLQVQLIDDLLDVSRIINGKLPLNVNAVNLSLIITSVLDTVRLSAETKQIKIETILEPEVKSILGDATRLHQVVWNLLSNAIKFTPPCGQIAVKLTEKISNHPGFVQLTITDTGKGIKPEFLPHLFKYFRQEDASTTRHFGGLGLGLAIVRQVVELHGGTVEAESQGEGQGATFTINLPLPRNDSEQHGEQLISAATPVSESLSLPLTGIRLLLVDDDNDSLNLYKFILELSGAIVTTANSGAKAIKSLETELPDVLLSDIGMPDMNGYMLMQEVKALELGQGRKISAIAITAYTRETDRELALAAGFQLHLPKPIDPEALMTAILQLLVRT